MFMRSVDGAYIAEILVPMTDEKRAEHELRLHIKVLGFLFAP